MCPSASTLRICDGGVGVATTGEDELSSDWNEAGACVRYPRAYTPVVGHVHKVNGNVVTHEFSTISLFRVFATSTTLGWRKPSEAFSRLPAITA
jgi:hypothetical protein